MHGLLPFMGAVAVAYGVLCVWVFFTQRGQICFPTPASEAPGAQALWVESQGERIKVWAVPRRGGLTLLYFGGSAEDVAGVGHNTLDLSPRHLEAVREFLAAATDGEGS